LVKFFYYDTSYIFFFALIVYFILIIKGICVDEGSSLLRLFKPIEEFDLDCILKEEKEVEIEEEISHLTIDNRKNDKFKYELASSIYKVIKSNLCFLFYLKAF